MMRIRHSSWRSKLLSALATTLGAVGSFYLAKNMSVTWIVKAQVKAEPFYLERTVSMPDDNGNLSVFRHEVVARRSDGATARVKSIGPPSSAGHVREVVFPDGKSMFLFDEIKVKSTLPRSKMSAQELSAFKLTLTNSKPDCGVRAPDTLVRFDNLKGQAVAVIQTIITGHYRLTRWLAPKLGCEALYYKSETIREDGAFSISAEVTPSEFVLGEPDSRLFDTGEGYSESWPSEARSSLLRHMGLVLTPAEEQQVQQEGRQADRQYRPNGPFRVK